jgi:hypothetical protein
MNLRAAPLRHRRNIWPWFLVASLFLVAGIPWLPTYRNGSLLLSAVGSLWALAFYLHARHGEDAKFAKELLTDFNKRYNDLNDDLQRAIWREDPFSLETKVKFIAYFNLCAEEWLFWSAGYIYDPVWSAWENGMKQYSCDERVLALWMEEERTNSYYGFRLPK